MVMVDQPMKLGKRTVQTVAEFPCPKCNSQLEAVEYSGHSYGQKSLPSVSLGFACEDCGYEIQPSEAQDFAYDCLNRYTDNY